MNIFKTIPVLALFLGAVSCTDFLKETSQDEIKPTSANDYKELITGEIYNETNNTAVNTYLDIMTDDCEEFARNAFLGGDTRNAGFGYFTWQQNPELQVEGVLNSDNAWAHYYHQILMTNMILYDIDNMNGTDQEKSLVKAEAHMIRAYAYYMLVNLYGEPYDPATASSALGVPINNLVGAQDVKFQRASVQDIYDIITDDCKAAINYFIAGGIHLIQQSKSHFRIFFNNSIYCFDRLFICFFNPDDSFFCSDSLSYRMEHFCNLGCMLFKKLSVQPQEWLTLRTVQNDRFRTLVQLRICRESCTTCTDDAVLLQYAA